MGIYLPNMEMPTSCWDCPLGDSLRCQVLPSVPALWAEYTKAVRDKLMHSDCPLVPVPPHGRLIDADALADQMAERRSYVGRLSDPLCLIEDAPTIIEAEGEE